MKIAKILIALMMTMILAGTAYALPLTLEDVKINDVQLSESAENALSLERGEDYDVTFKVSSTEELNDLEIEAFISGYEYNDIEEIRDNTGLFDMSADTTYVKKLTITIPENLELDTYTLRFLATDRNDEELVQNYKLKIDAPRHKLNIKDVLLHPAGETKAGTSLLVTVRLDNKGQKDQKYVKVTVSMPQLGIEGASYIEEILQGEEMETEEIFLRIPSNAETGTYEVKVVAKYSEFKTVSSTQTLNVVADENYNDGTEPQIVIVPLSVEETVEVESTATYPISITNLGKTSRAVTIVAQIAEWAETTVSESAMVLAPGEAQTTFVDGLKRTIEWYMRKK